MKIYTKSGDQGETGLLGGIRVSKSHLAIETCGGLDETNSLVGVARSESLEQPINKMLTQIQNDLFDLGSRVAACVGESARPADFPDSRILQLENWIDQLQSELPELEAFILPSGGSAGAILHLARAVCRRTERQLVSLIESVVKRDLTTEMVYLNRLGDLLFVIARHVNQAAGASETVWSVTRV